ncbi:Uncharacterised protein [Vibrio cholerae]|nr:Uncharacterised protein [Vibrio cholerae]CSC37480.1 Uncharacterised protein [Vibrio cholerae]
MPVSRRWRVFDTSDVRCHRTQSGHFHQQFLQCGQRALRLIVDIDRE